MGNPHANNYQGIFINLASTLSSYRASLYLLSNRSAKVPFNDVLYQCNMCMAHKHMVILFDFYLICVHIIVSMHRGSLRPLFILHFTLFLLSFRAVFHLTPSSTKIKTEDKISESVLKLGSKGERLWGLIVHVS